VQLRAHELDEAAEALDDALAAIDLAAAEGAQIVVLPEMAYPAYFLGSRQAYRNAAGSETAVLGAFAGRARQHGLVLAVGMGITRGDDVVNSAILFGPDGEEIGRYAKSFLWHFDRKWFTPGSQYPTFETPFGRVGMLICADSRAPEIARALAISGAEIILDPTAWVSSGRTMETLYTPQTDYIMPTRALENGVPIAAANKWGPEAGTIIFAGRSCILDAEGRSIADGPTDEDSCIIADVELRPAAPPVRRRPELYADLVRPTMRRRRAWAWRNCAG
jgi:predicted amidohydrolase